MPTSLFSRHLTVTARFPKQNCSLFLSSSSSLLAYILLWNVFTSVCLFLSYIWSTAASCESFVNFSDSVAAFLDYFRNHLNSGCLWYLPLIWLVDGCCLYCSSLTLQVVLHLNVKHYPCPPKEAIYYSLSPKSSSVHIAVNLVITFCWTVQELAHFLWVFLCEEQILFCVILNGK